MSEVAKESAPHPCWAKVNEALAPRNAALDMTQTVDFDSGRIGTALYIPLRNKYLAPVFCPFCGEKLS